MGWAGALPESRFRPAGSGDPAAFPGAPGPLLMLPHFQLRPHPGGGHRATTCARRGQRAQQERGARAAASRRFYVALCSPLWFLASASFPTPRYNVTGLRRTLASELEPGPPLSGWKFVRVGVTRAATVVSGFDAAEPRRGHAPTTVTVAAPQWLSWARLRRPRPRCIPPRRPLVLSCGFSPPRATAAPRRRANPVPRWPGGDASAEAL